MRRFSFPGASVEVTLMFNGDHDVLVGPVGLGCLSVHNKKESNWFSGVS